MIEWILNAKEVITTCIQSTKCTLQQQLKDVRTSNLTIREIDMIQLASQSKTLFKDKLQMILMQAKMILEVEQITMERHLIMEAILPVLISKMKE
jgi:hypothetical protein